MFPKIAAQWGAHKNRGLTPFDITHGSGREVWWRCGKGGDHIWLQQVTVRTRPGSGCPFCAGKRPSITNSLATRAPMVAAEWHRTRNRPLTPKDVTTGTSRFVWWRCAKARDHEWGATIYDRVARKTACPFCAGHRVSSTSSLARVRPDVAKMWHPTKNRSLTPHDVLPNSGRSVWWRCTEAPDHVWRGPIANKIRHGCPFCKGRRLCCSNSLAVVAPEVAAQWHGPKNGRLRPSDVFHRSGRIVWWKCDAAADHEWRTAVVNRRKMGPGCPFCSGKWLAPSSSLAARFPALAAQWHRLKNRSLRPIDVHPGTNRHVWWKCAAGPDHQWRADIRVRVRYPRCPFCAGRRASATNSLAKLFPKVAREWHRFRNRGVTPADVLAAARDLAWWRCALGHEWRASVRERTAGGKSCPACAEASFRLRRFPRASATRGA